MKFDPRNYQRHAIDTVIRQKKCALHIGMGLGKTVSVLTAIKHLRDNFAITGVLVFAPLKVATLTWPSEVRKWDHLTDLDVAIVRGKTPQDRLRILNERHDIYVINYDHVPWICQCIMAGRNNLPFDMVVFDESSKLKSGQSKRFKTLKSVIVSPLFPRVVEMTGTPMPEQYENLWSQFYLLDGGKRLTPFVTHFRSKWMEQSPWNRYDWKMRPGAGKEIRQRISDITLALRSEDWLELKKPVINDIEIELPPRAREIYDEMEDEMVTKINNKEIVGGNKAIAGEKCRQVANGFIYSEKNGKTTAEAIHTIKMDALEEIIDQSDDNLLVAFWYKWEQEQFRKRWPKAPILGSGVADRDATKIVTDWNAGKTKVLFIHPASVGHGINLQGGGNNLIFTAVPWSGEAYDQTIHRLHRLGQTKPVIVHRLLAANTVEQRVAKALAAKDFSQKVLLDALSVRSRKVILGK